MHVCMSLPPCFSDGSGPGRTRVGLVSWDARFLRSLPPSDPSFEKAPDFRIRPPSLAKEAGSGREPQLDDTYLWTVLSIPLAQQLSCIIQTSSRSPRSLCTYDFATAVWMKHLTEIVVAIPPWAVCLHTTQGACRSPFARPW